MHLYETHLPVADTNVAQKFYCEIVGLPLAYRDPTRDIIFLWASLREKGMIGLWGPGTEFGERDGRRCQCHLALSVSLQKLPGAIKKLNQSGIKTFGFGGIPSAEPTVIGWMPSAQIYFRDPDGHLVEFISILPNAPNPDFIGPYSEWKKRTSASGR